MGGGIATLYFSVFAAANFHKLIGLPVAFGVMVCVTVLAGWLAVRFESKLVAILGIIGGYLTPVMLSTGVVNFPGLYGYMLVLGTGILGVSLWRNWPLAGYLAFVGTFALFFASLRDYEPSYFWQVMPFLVAFFVLFSTMAFIYNVMNKVKSNLLDVLALFLNAGVFFFASHHLIHAQFGRRWVAAVTLGLAVFYAAHVVVCFIRKLVDRELILSFAGLAATFLAISAPLLLSRQWITLAWAVQALVILWLALQVESRFLRYASYLLFGLVLFRFTSIDFHTAYGTSPPDDMTAAIYFRQLLERLMTFGVPIISMAAANWLLKRHEKSDSKYRVNPDNDVPDWLPESMMPHVFVGATALMVCTFLHLEFNQTLGRFYDPLRQPTLTLVWLGLSLFLLQTVIRTGSSVLLNVLIALIACVILKVFVFDLPDYRSGNFLIFDEFIWRDSGLRFLDFGAVVGFLAFAYFHYPTGEINNARGMASGLLRSHYCSYFLAWN